MRNVFFVCILGSLGVFLLSPAVAATNAITHAALHCDKIASEIPGLPAATTGVARIELRYGSRIVRIAPGADEPATGGSYDVRLYDQTNTTHLSFVDGLVLSCDGCPKQAWFVDLKHDGQPEVVVWVASGGVEKNGLLDLFEIIADEQGDALQRVEPPEAAHSWLRGHRGHDAYRVEHGTLYWTFPVFRSDDSDEHPTGGEITLKLIFERERWMWRLHARK